MASFSTLFSTLILTIALLSFSCSSQQFFSPVEKDPITNLFSTLLWVGTEPTHEFNFVIDIGGPILWYDCNKAYNSSTYNPISCESKHCTNDAGCTSCNGPFKPGCSNNTCGANIINPLVDAIFSGDTGSDALFIPKSKIKVSDFISGCTDSNAFADSADSDFPLKNLPKTSKGILGLARTPLSLPKQLSLAPFKLLNKFALCLPSSNNLGSLFIGGVGSSLSKFQLTKVPLVINPFSTAPIFTDGDASYEYFIDVKSIKVGGEVLSFKSSLLSIDNKGNGGTKLSTMKSFTVLHSSIFKPLVRDFTKKASDKKIKKVASVAPFDTCFDLSTIGKTNTGLDVPTIGLVLEGGVEWTIFGGNSMVLVSKNVACLGFVDGGKEPRTAVVIGGHQLEDIVLEFDLVSSKLGFSSSLLLQNASCSNSNSVNKMVKSSESFISVE
ncbi:probable aspartic proteinase GIP2 [Medicago truncatula]|uniref:Extracellular dermal glycoprotein n=2 Tax=Medicago truncatula TaxID=3880 RepID=A0A072VF47_MEDTR|nr:probable aspartic proteinase GIP2 [Medicago truncatula]KEH36780.1 extracellular dermal glycoprotein [Medicago truncatula]